MSRLPGWFISCCSVTLSWIFCATLVFAAGLTRTDAIAFTTIYLGSLLLHESGHLFVTWKLNMRGHIVVTPLGGVLQIDEKYRERMLDLPSEPYILLFAAGMFANAIGILTAVVCYWSGILLRDYALLLCWFNGALIATNIIPVWFFDGKRMLDEFPFLSAAEAYRWKTIFAALACIGVVAILLTNYCLDPFFRYY